MPTRTLSSTSSLFSLAVPKECRKWARRQGVPLKVVLQRLVDVGALLLDTVQVPQNTVPSVHELLAAAAFPTDAPAAFVRDETLAAVDPLVPPEELGLLPSDCALERVPVLASRLRSYAVACRVVHPDLDGPQLAFVVSSYAVALGVPTAGVDAVVTAVLDPVVPPV